MYCLEMYRGGYFGIQLYKKNFYHHQLYFAVERHTLKIEGEYDQEIPQSQTADKPMAS